MTKQLLIVIEVEEENWRIRDYRKLGEAEEKIPFLIADDFLSADGEYAGQPIVRAEWVE